MVQKYRRYCSCSGNERLILVHVKDEEVYDHN